MHVSLDLTEASFTMAIVRTQACVLLMGIYHRENIAATNPCMRQQDHESLSLIFNDSLGTAKYPEASTELISSAFTVHCCFTILYTKIEVLRKGDLY
jgi:hypothetical protein